MKLKRGTEGVEVNLISTPKKKDVDRIVYYFARTTEIEKIVQEVVDKEYLVGTLKGKYLSVGLETLQFVFEIKGISRTCTHQLVRTRIGACYGQQSQRAIHLQNIQVTIPRTITKNKSLYYAFENVCVQAEAIYKRMLKEGIPPQDARFILPEGVRTNIVIGYNFKALQGLMLNRLCKNMQWEINIVCQKIKELVYDFDPRLGLNLKPLCDKIKKCVYGFDMFVPCKKYPYDYGKEYQYSKEANAIYEEENV